jgi:hypothetical protein
MSLKHLEREEREEEGEREREREREWEMEREREREGGGRENLFAASIAQVVANPIIAGANKET